MLQTADVAVPGALIADSLPVPDPEENRVDGGQDRTDQETASRIARAHAGALSRRRYRDLTAEKYLLHIDGSGESQWADLYKGERIVFPRDRISGIRAQENLMRPIIENAVAYHTTMPFEFIVEAKKDRSSRKQAKVEQAWINSLVQEARWNAVHHEAMNLAMAYGSCPVHQTWREDADFDQFEPVQIAMREGQFAEVQRGFIDCWAGNPFDTTYDAGSTLGSIYAMRYARLVPAQMVRDAWGIEVEGSTKIPSASVYQRIARKWQMLDLNVHGTGTLYSGPDSDELIAVLFEEIPPFADSRHPDGVLRVVVLDGAAAVDREASSEGGTYRNAMLVHKGPLPGGDFSARLVYSKARYDDVLGSPFAADLDELQIHLNQAISLEKEYMFRARRAPLVTTPGSLGDDTTVWEADAEIEVEPTMTSFQPYFLGPYAEHLQTVAAAKQEARDAMFRIGGWQAASRGEANAGDPASKVVALAKYDDQIHGPVNLRFRETVEANARFAWKLMKEFGDVAWLVGEVGDELAHFADLWVSRDELSDRPPKFTLVSGYGASAEARGQQLINLFGMTDSQGREVLDTPTFKRLWPDQGLFANSDDAEEIRRRRPHQINDEIEKACISYRETNQFAETMYAHPWVQQAAMEIFVAVDANYPLLMDDLVEAHMEALTLLTQDETQDPLIRWVARYRQDQIMQWMAARQAGVGGPPPSAGGAPPGAQPPPGGAGAEGRNVIQQAQPANTINSDAMQNAQAQVPGLTAEAAQGG